MLENTTDLQPHLRQETFEAKSWEASRHETWGKYLLLASKMPVAAFIVATILTYAAKNPELYELEVNMLSNRDQNAITSQMPPNDQIRTQVMPVTTTESRLQAEISIANFEKTLAWLANQNDPRLQKIAGEIRDSLKNDEPFVSLTGALSPRGKFVVVGSNLAETTRLSLLVSVPAFYNLGQDEKRAARDIVLALEVIKLANDEGVEAYHRNPQLQEEIQMRASMNIDAKFPSFAK